MQKIRQLVPWAMAAGRGLLGPVLLIGDRCGWSGFTLAAMVVTALLSDIFDGVLARRWRVDTAAVRLFDSMCDMVFYVCVGVALWLFQPRLLSGNLGLLCALLAVEAANFAANFAKYGRPASYHSYLAKAWGLVLAAAIAAAFVSGHAGLLMRVALWMGVASNVETIAMSLMLPVWRRDVKTLAEAWRIRKEICGCERKGLPDLSTSQDCGRFARLVERAITWAGTAIIAGLSLMATSAFAAQPEQARYVGGTEPVAVNTAGTFDTVSPNELNFSYMRKDGTGEKISIDYAKVVSIEPTEEPRPFGVLPLIAIALVVRLPERHFVTIQYVDENAVRQVAMFAVGRPEQRILVAVVNARSKDCWGQPSAPCNARKPLPQR